MGELLFSLFLGGCLIVVGCIYKINLSKEFKHLKQRND